MNLRTGRKQENKDQSIANSVAQSKSTSTNQFVDNRPEATVQRKVQEAANTSLQAKQLKASQENKLRARKVAQFQPKGDYYFRHQHVSESLLKNQSSSRIDNSNIGKSTIQRITDEEHQKLYSSEQPPLGLRFQPGAGLPDNEISGDQYSLQDERYQPSTDFDKKFPHLAGPSASSNDYSRILNNTIGLSIGQVRKEYFERKSHDLSLKETFDKVRSEGQLVILNSRARGLRSDYDGAFSSLGKGMISPKDFKVRVPIINAFDYEKYEGQLDQKWSESWITTIWPHILSEVINRVHDAITLAIGGKLGRFKLRPDLDPDPEEHLAGIRMMDEFLLNE